jgi:glutamine cyclotransferase
LIEESDVMVWLPRVARSVVSPLFALLLLVPGCEADGRQSGSTDSAAKVDVVNRYPHDRGAYTQGLSIHDGVLYEGTGLVGESSLRRVELETGKVLARVDLKGDHFGEGVAIVGERIYQLTWKAGIAFVYDLASLSVVDSLRYQGEGWGLTYDGSSLIMSDGSDRLRFVDPASFQEQRVLQVRDRGAPLTSLNELEFIEGEIWANVYQSDYIVRIDPASGNVTGWIDLRGLLSREERTGGVDVLNGIAWDAANRRLFVTGKRWPYLLQVSVRPGV